MSFYYRWLRGSIILSILDTHWQRWSSWMPAPPIGCRSWSGCIWIFHRGFPWSWLCEHRIGPPPFPHRNTRCRLRAAVPSTALFHLPPQVSRRGTPEAVYPLCTKFAGSRPIGRPSVVLARCPRLGSISMLKMIKRKDYLKMLFHYLLFIFKLFYIVNIREWFYRGLIK